MYGIISERVDAALGWYNSLSSEEQKQATIYAYRDVRELIFDKRFGIQKLEKAGGKFASAVLLYNEPENPNQFVSEIENIIQILVSVETNFVLADCVVRSVRHEGWNHAVAIKFDKNTQAVHYQDLNGDKIRAEIEDALREYFSAYCIIDYQVKQQNSYDCGLLSVHNLIAFAKGESPEPKIEEDALRYKIEDAPAILEWGKNVIVDLPVEDVDPSEKDLWKQWKAVADAITTDNPDLAPKEWPQWKFTMMLAKSVNG